MVTSADECIQKNSGGFTSVSDFCKPRTFEFPNPDPMHYVCELRLNRIEIIGKRRDINFQVIAMVWLQLFS